MGRAGLVFNEGRQGYFLEEVVSQLSWEQVDRKDLQSGRSTVGVRGAAGTRSRLA